MPEVGNGEFTEIKDEGLKLSVKFTEAGWMWHIHNVGKPEADRKGNVGSLEEGKAHLQREFGPFLQWAPCFLIDGAKSLSKRDF